MPIKRNYPLLFIEVERPLILCQERLCSEPWRNLALGNGLFNMCKPCTRTKLPENRQYQHWWIGGYLGGVPQSSIFSLFFFTQPESVFLGTSFFDFFLYKLCSALPFFFADSAVYICFHLFIIVTSSKLQNNSNVSVIIYKINFQIFLTTFQFFEKHWIIFINLRLNNN